MVREQENGTGSVPQRELKHRENVEGTVPVPFFRAVTEVRAKEGTSGYCTFQSRSTPHIENRKVECPNGTDLSRLLFAQTGLERCAGFSEARVLFGTAFDGPWFDAVGTVADLLAGNQAQHRFSDFA